jgi:hypothetical protein
MLLMPGEFPASGHHEFSAQVFFIKNVHNGSGGQKACMKVPRKNNKGSVTSMIASGGHYF